jgi:hypothetical protein
VTLRAQRRRLVLPLPTGLRPARSGSLSPSGWREGRQRRRCRG